MKNSRIGRNLRSAAFFLLTLIITPILLLSCASAKKAQNNTIYHDSARSTSRYDSVNHRQSHWQDTQQHDSVYKQDSVLVYIKGDTVIKERWNQLTTTKWKTITKTDTIVGDTYVCVTDTIKVKYYVNRYKTKVIEKPQTTWHKMRLFIGDCVIVLLMLVAANWAMKRIKKK